MVQDDRLSEIAAKPALSRAEVLQLAGGVQFSTLWRQMHRGLFPPPLDHPGHNGLWAGASVRRWLLDRELGVTRDWFDKRVGWRAFQSSISPVYDPRARKYAPRNAGTNRRQRDLPPELRPEGGNEQPAICPACGQHWPNDPPANDNHPSPEAKAQ
jgi:hypothetical protein